MFGDGGPSGTTTSAATHSQLKVGDPSSKCKAMTTTTRPSQKDKRRKIELGFCLNNV
ncbi:hypothetical protein Scep_007546 [Stephania cephalantha]|uniref:Uncharacterized protein n=1 Tax=Stephania cephalantha TaxID=152367 RepID=A0AAP0KC24_9MAGN